MHILLLTVASIGLERLRQWLAVDEKVTCDDAHIGALGQDVEKRGLTGTTLTHQGCHLARRDVARHMIQQTARLAFDHDIVRDVVPTEHCVRHFEMATSLGGWRLSCILRLSRCVFFERLFLVIHGR